MSAAEQPKRFDETTELGDKMAKTVYYSFHYDRDAWRVQQVANMGAVESQPIMNAQEWEAVKRKGDAAIKQWIQDQMANKSALVVLVGTQTANRPWVQYEIGYAWDNYKPIVGIRIHGLADKSGLASSAGPNPFDHVKLKNGDKVSKYVPIFTPSGATSQAVYADIKKNLVGWVDRAVKRS